MYMAADQNRVLHLIFCRVSVVNYVCLLFCGCCVQASARPYFWSTELRLSDPPTTESAHRRMDYEVCHLNFCLQAKLVCKSAPTRINENAIDITVSLVEIR